MAWWKKTSEPAPAVQAAEERSVVSISDPAFAALIGLDAPNGPVSEANALGLAAFYSGVKLISDTIASLPLKTYQIDAQGQRQRVPNFLETFPCGPNTDTTYFEWCSLVMVHLLIHGNAYLVHVKNGAGVVVGLQPVHPCAVSIELTSTGAKVFRICMADGTQKVLTTNDLTHIPALSTDGVHGISPLTACRLALNTAKAGDEAANALFNNGALLGGIVSPKGESDDFDADDAEAVQAAINAKAVGSANAGKFLVVAQSLDFSPWTLSAADAQFVESRKWQLEEIARILNISPHLLGHTEKSTSWGSGIAEQNLAFQRHCLAAWASRIEQRLSRLLPNPEIDFTGFLRPTPEQEIRLILDEVNGGLISLNEGRKVRNLAPVDGGDEYRVPSGVMLITQLLASANPEPEPTSEPTDEEPETEDEEAA